MNAGAKKVVSVWNVTRRKDSIVLVHQDKRIEKEGNKNAKRKILL